jgi:hypothetical protein
MRHLSLCGLRLSLTFQSRRLLKRPRCMNHTVALHLRFLFPPHNTTTSTRLHLPTRPSGNEAALTSPTDQQAKPQPCPRTRERYVAKLPRQHFRPAHSPIAQRASTDKIANRVVRTGEEERTRTTTRSASLPSRRRVRVRPEHKPRAQSLRSPRSPHPRPNDFH